MKRALLVLLFASTARAGDPDLIWRTLETPHFYIHYYVLAPGAEARSSGWREGEEAVAQRIAAVAEDAHRRLVRVIDARYLEGTGRLEKALADAGALRNATAEDVTARDLQLRAHRPRRPGPTGPVRSSRTRQAGAIRSPPRQSPRAP